MPSCEGAMVSGPVRNRAYSGAHQAATDQRMIGLVQRPDAVDLEDRPLLQMILQVAADARACRAARGCPSSVSQSAGPTPESCRISGEPTAPADRMTSPLARASKSRPFCRNWTPTAALALEQHLFDQHAGLETEIGAAERGLQEGARRGPAQAALLVDVEVADAGVVAGVEVRRSPECPFRSPPGRPRPARPSSRAAARPAIRRPRRDARWRRGSDCRAA